MLRVARRSLCALSPLPLLALTVGLPRVAGTQEYAGTGCSLGVVSYDPVERPGGGVRYTPRIGDVACLNVRAFTTQSPSLLSPGGGLEWRTRLTWTGWLNPTLRLTSFGVTVDAASTGLFTAPSYVGFQPVLDLPGGSACGVGFCDVTFRQSPPWGDPADPRIPTAALFNAYYRLENGEAAPNSIALNVPLHAVPEPSTYLLLGTGLLAVGGIAARRGRA